MTIIAWWTVWLCKLPINRSMILQMAQICRVPLDQSILSIKVLPVHQRNWYRDCGLFAITFTTEISRGQDPNIARVLYVLLSIQSQMQGHFFICLTKGNMMPFPQFIKQEKATLPQHMTLCPKINTLKVTIHCMCRMPDHYDWKVIQCEACLGWYHYACTGIKKRERYQWGVWPLHTASGHSWKTKWIPN